MLHSADDTRLTPDQRCRAVATILAGGVLRLRQVSPPPRESAAPDTPQNPLELSTTGRPHVTRG
jgi:hypothetical protein